MASTSLGEYIIGSISASLGTNTFSHWDLIIWQHSTFQILKSSNAQKVITYIEFKCAFTTPNHCPPSCYSYEIQIFLRIHTRWTYYNWEELHLLIKLICFSVRVETNIASKLRILKYFLDVLLSVWRHHYGQEGNRGDLRHKEDPTFKEIMGI